MDAVIDIDIPLNKLLKRLTGRRVCSSCGESYHVDYLGASRTCAKCGGHLVHRADDTEETVKERLDVYVSKTAPLIDFYEKTGVLKKVNGDLPIEKVLAEIEEALK